MPNENTVKGILEFARDLDDIDSRVLREGLAIVRLHRQIEQIVEQIWAGWGLTVRQVEIMESLYHNAGETTTPAELSDEVGLTRSAMTSTLDSLEDLGYTTRAPHPTDRRMVAIQLTSEGRAFIRQCLPERYRKLGRIMGSLSAEERSELLNAYSKVLNALVREEAKEVK